ncbi:MAG: sulfite exporter TauE/SafE family protein [Vicinamibacterales bacterium]
MAGGTSLLLFGAGACAGVMNAVAGGGSFLTLPALVFAGLPSVTANASSTVALAPATLASVWAYMSGPRRTGLVDVGGVPIIRLIAMSAAGGLTGAVLLLSTPVRLFDGILPWLLLLATCAFLFGGRVSAYLRERAHGGPAAVLPLQFLVGIYGGYFGGAVGIMALAAWSLVDRHDLKALHPTRMLTVAAMNVIAVAYFVARGEVRWPETLAMLVGAVAGGFLGGRLGQRLPPTVTRYIILGVTIGTTLVFFRRAYF